MADYSNNGKNPLAVGLDSNGDKCKKNLKWSWTSDRSGKETDFKNITQNLTLKDLKLKTSNELGLELAEPVSDMKSPKFRTPNLP